MTAPAPSLPALRDLVGRFPLLVGDIGGEDVVDAAPGPGLDPAGPTEHLDLDDLTGPWPGFLE